MRHLAEGLRCCLFLKHLRSACPRPSSLQRLLPKGRGHCGKSPGLEAGRGSSCPSCPFASAGGPRRMRAAPLIPLRRRWWRRRAGGDRLSENMIGTTGAEHLAIYIESKARCPKASAAVAEAVHAPCRASSSFHLPQPVACHVSALCAHRLPPSRSRCFKVVVKSCARCVDAPGT